MLKKATLWDVLIILIGSVAIVGFWRGVWNLFDKFLYPNSFLVSNIISIAAGVLILGVLSRYK